MGLQFNDLLGLSLALSVAPVTSSDVDKCIYYIYLYILYIHIYIYIYIYIYVYNKANDSKKVHLFYIKFRIFILIIHIINRYLKSVFTVNLFQDLFSSVKFP